MALPPAAGEAPSQRRPPWRHGPASARNHGGVAQRPVPPRRTGTACTGPAGQAVPEQGAGPSWPASQPPCCRVNTTEEGASCKVLPPGHSAPQCCWPLDTPDWAGRASICCWQHRCCHHHCCSRCCWSCCHQGRGWQQARRARLSAGDTTGRPPSLSLPSAEQAAAAAGAGPAAAAPGLARRGRTSRMNFLQTGRMSEERVAENIMTCLSWGVFLKIACTHRAARREQLVQYTLIGELVGCPTLDTAAPALVLPRPPPRKRSVLLRVCCAAGEERPEPPEGSHAQCPARSRQRAAEVPDFTCTSVRMSMDSRHLSHSSTMKCRTWLRSSVPSSASCGGGKTRAGEHVQLRLGVLVTSQLRKGQTAGCHGQPGKASMRASRRRWEQGGQRPAAWRPHDQQGCRQHQAKDVHKARPPAAALACMHCPHPCTHPLDAAGRAHDDVGGLVLVLQQVAVLQQGGSTGGQAQRQSVAQSKSSQVTNRTQQTAACGNLPGVAASWHRKAAGCGREGAARAHSRPPCGAACSPHYIGTCICSTHCAGRCYPSGTHDIANNPPAPP